MTGANTMTGNNANRTGGNTTTTNTNRP
jgi:hypothetical protein